MTQLHWATIQKEAYTIYYCAGFNRSGIFLRVTYYVFLTRAKKLFTISFGQKHECAAKKNLSPFSYFFIPIFSFTANLIAGKDNGIANSMSRFRSHDVVVFPKAVK